MDGRHKKEVKQLVRKKDRVYISGAITGTDDYMDRFAAAEKKLEAEGYTVINPARIMAQLPKDTEYEEYMEMSILLLQMCSTLYQLKGWEKSTGANREYGYALATEMTIRREEQR